MELIYVNAWNCRATIVTTDGELNEDSMSEKQREAIEALKEYIIYSVNQGALNWSGEYYPDDLAVEIFEEILRGNCEAIQRIGDISDREITEKAREMISELREHELLEISDTGLQCSEFCHGYHNKRYLTRINGELKVVDDGYGHHAMFSTPRGVVASLGISISDLTEGEALKELSEHIRAIADKYDYTKAEFESIEDLRLPCELRKCERCNQFYYFEHYCEEEGE
jgi:hypothetical protein